MGRVRFRSLLSVVVMVVMCVLALPNMAFAEGANSLTVHLEHAKTIVPNSATRIYFVASADPVTGAYDFTDSFDDANVDLSGALNDGSASYWDGVAQRLESFVGENDIAPLQKAASDAGGDAKYTGLDDGLYLVVVDSAEVNGSTYRFSSYMVALPSVDSSGAVVRSVTSVPKSSEYKPNLPPTPTPPKPPTPPTPERIASTGEPWRPIIPLVLGGLVLVVAGWKLRSYAYDEQSEK